MNYLFALVLIFTPAPAIRQAADLGPVVTDVESHLNSGHPYRDADRITWVHEGTHGVNSYLRNRHGCPAFYCLNNLAVLMPEPATTLAQVAGRVPVSLRGEVYNLYLVQMQSYWNDQPSYVFDEWIAYTNGAEARQRLGIADRGETLRYASEFIAYAACVAWASGSTDPQMKAFFKWQTARVIKLGGRIQMDDAGLRVFIRNYCGPRWTKETLGF